MSSGFLALYILVNRMCVFAVFFLAILCGYLFLKIIQKIPKALYIPIVILLVSWEIYGLDGYHVQKGIKNSIFNNDNEKKAASFSFPYNLAELTTWIRMNTGRDSVFISDFQFGPSILLNTDRPIVFHSKFESRPIRDKYREFIFALFDSEEEFYEICRKYGAEYFVYDVPIVLDRSRESRRYLTNSIKLDRNTPAFKFHFDPDSLKHFNLCFRDALFSVYQVVENRRNMKKYDYPYIPAYDLSSFKNNAGSRYFEN